MKPSFYLEPDAGKMQSFFHSLSLHKEFTDETEKICINKIWIDETEGSWEFEYSSSAQIDPKLLDALSDHIKASFSLKTLTWKQLQVDEIYLQAYNALYGNKFADGCLFGKIFKAEEIIPLNRLTEARRHIVIQGHIGTQRDKDDKLVAFTEREVRGRNKDSSRLLVQFNVIDEGGGIYVKVFFDDPDEGKEFIKHLKPGMELQLLGNAEPDQYNHDVMTFSPVAIKKTDIKQREDNAPVKRIELHCHTKMSKLDAIIDVKDLVKTAIRFGHKALAITDHGVIQAFPFCADAVEDAVI